MGLSMHCLHLFCHYKFIYFDFKVSRRFL
jgi:hypothetical protein